MDFLDQSIIAPSTSILCAIPPRVPGTSDEVPT